MKSQIARRSNRRNTNDDADVDGSDAGDDQAVMPSSQTSSSSSSSRRSMIAEPVPVGGSGHTLSIREEESPTIPDHQHELDRASSAAAAVGDSLVGQQLLSSPPPAKIATTTSPTATASGAETNNSTTTSSRPLNRHQEEEETSHRPRRSTAVTKSRSIPINDGNGPQPGATRVQGRAPFPSATTARLNVNQFPPPPMPSPSEATGRFRSSRTTTTGGGSLELVEAFRVPSVNMAEAVHVVVHDEEQGDTSNEQQVTTTRQEQQQRQIEEQQQKIKNQKRWMCLGVVVCIIVVVAIIIAMWIANDNDEKMQTIAPTERKLQIIHSGEHESAFQDINTLEEKVLHYSSLVEGLRKMMFPASIHVSSGDIVFPGPFYDAASEVESWGNQRGMGDIQMFNAMRLDATVIGNHEFNKGLGDFATLLDASAFPFLSVNLDLSQAQVPDGAPDIVIGKDGSLCQDVAGQVVKSCVLETPIGQVGLIGRSSNALFRLVEDPDSLAGVAYFGGTDPESGATLVDSSILIQEQVFLLESNGVNILILLDQGFGVYEDIEEVLNEELNGIDIVIGESQKNNVVFARPDSFGPFNLLRPEDTIESSYPLVRRDGSGNRVLFVNCGTSYRYVGSLVVTFDDSGFISSWDGLSGPIATTQEAVELLEDVVGETLNPVPLVADTLKQLQNTPSIQDSFTVIGSTMYPLEGSRAAIRTRETNLGHLIADSYLWAGNLYAAEHGILPVDVAFKNAGGIRDSIPGPSITRLSVQSTLAFNNKLILVELNAGQLLAALENAVSAYPIESGIFLQVSGLRLQVNTTMPSIQGVAYTETPSRLRSVILDKEGRETIMVRDYQFQTNTRNQTFVVATNNYMGSGGDLYESIAEGRILSETGIGEQQFLEDYVVSYLDEMVGIQDPPQASRMVIIDNY